MDGFMGNHVGMKTELTAIVYFPVHFFVPRTPAEKQNEPLQGCLRRKIQDQSNLHA